MKKTMDHIQCSSCNRQVIPRLWHYSPILGRFRYLKTQHLCPFCGVEMYTTGGSINFVGKIVLVLLFLLTFSTIRRALNELGPVGNILASVIGLTIIAIIYLTAAKAVWRFIKSFISGVRNLISK